MFGENSDIFFSVKIVLFVPFFNKKSFDFEITSAVDFIFLETVCGLCCPILTETLSILQDVSVFSFPNKQSYAYKHFEVPSLLWSPASYSESSLPPNKFCNNFSGIVFENQSFDCLPDIMVLLLANQHISNQTPRWIFKALFCIVTTITNFCCDFYLNFEDRVVWLSYLMYLLFRS